MTKKVPKTFFQKMYFEVRSGTNGLKFASMLLPELCWPLAIGPMAPKSAASSQLLEKLIEKNLFHIIRFV